MVLFGSHTRSSGYGTLCTDVLLHGGHVESTQQVSFIPTPGRRVVGNCVAVSVALSMKGTVCRLSASRRMVDQSSPRRVCFGSIESSPSCLFALRVIRLSFPTTTYRGGLRCVDNDEYFQCSVGDPLCSAILRTYYDSRIKEHDLVPCVTQVLHRESTRWGLVHTRSLLTTRPLEESRYRWFEAKGELRQAIISTRQGHQNRDCRGYRTRYCKRRVNGVRGR
ncbi:hypothetical protein B0O80DRAFT_282917 [Mortierella sp. GBAus27b]|nr:hypothetical protein B0O80DRAFT_282917 [Mortierella sp. GBAus27b]